MTTKFYIWIKITLVGYLTCQCLGDQIFAEVDDHDHNPPTYKLNIKRSEEFPHQLSDEQIGKIKKDEKLFFKVIVKVAETDERYPLEISVGGQPPILVPLVVRRGERVMCRTDERISYLNARDVLNSQPGRDNSSLTLNIYTNSSVSLKVNLTILLTDRKEDWDQKNNKNGAFFETNMSIKPYESSFKYFNTNRLETDSIIVKVRSQNDSGLCTLISIQDPLCPIKENLGEAMRFGVWSTMTKQGTILLSADWPHGLMIVLVTDTSGDVCATNSSNLTWLSRAQLFNITVGPNGNDKDSIIAISVIAASYFLIALITFCISVYFFKFKDVLEDVPKNFTERNQSIIHNFRKTIRQSKLLKSMRKSNVLKTIRESNVLEVENVNIKDQTLTEKDDETKKQTEPKYVSDISKKLNDKTKEKSVYQKTRLFLGVLCIASIFYTMPVIQMVFRMPNEEKATGKQDICYYNDLCSRNLGPFGDFNHIFSNIGYCVFGLIFIVIVYLRKQKFEKFEERMRDEQCVEDFSKFGVPYQPELYYSMGLALVMEGVMSACYHVCPSNVTFQFDTTFMYLIVILMYFKLFQVRHADISPNALEVFFGLGFALILEIISIYSNGSVFWISFCICYCSFIIVFAVYIYNLGRLKYSRRILFDVGNILAKEVKCILKNPKQICETNTRLALIVVLSLSNMVLCLYVGITGCDSNSSSSSFILAILGFNLASYIVYYCMMKRKNKERLAYVPLTYLVFSLLFFSFSFYFFTQKEKNSHWSHAQSRTLNRECIWLNFYDSHDIWHFLGSVGLYGAFMFLLTIDDDVRYERRDKIKIF